MRIGHGNALFLYDLSENVSDAEMRNRWKDGRYGKPRAEYVKGWRKMAGRENT